ncbi:MAG: hypothetical protein Q9220_002067 [cf. Caloplaca sp. 1 TL-2023]
MLQKICFVTIGATAAFDELLKAVLTSKFLEALQTLEYTSLLLQYGKNGQKMVQDFEFQIAGGREQRHGIEVVGFDFNKQGLGREMWSVKAGKDSAEGVVISHAGSGSILDALRIEVPIIVVPNTSLLHNHQVELAEELAKQGYVVHGRLDDLPSALGDSETLRRKRQAWPPRQHGADPSGKGLAGVMDEEMGFYD